MSSTDRRAAALAAAEARLRGDPTAHDLEEQARLDRLNPKEETWTPPSEKEDASAKRELGRLIDRGIVRDNGYKQAAEAVETLLKIANNILGSNDPKFRSIKSTSNVLKSKVLIVKGGHEFLIAMGFRTLKAEFVMAYILEPRLKRMHELRLAADVLESHLPDLQSRVSQLNSSKVNHKSDEASRAAKALREIDADRDEVRTRVEREKRSREYREKVRMEAEAKAKKEEEEKERLEAEVKAAKASGVNGSYTIEGEDLLGRGDGDGDGDEDEEDTDGEGVGEEEEAVLMGGRRLGN